MTRTANRSRVVAALAVLFSAAVGATAVLAAAPLALPSHVYAPYFEAWTSDSLSTIATQSGARYFTLAFLETTSRTSCTLAWNGSRTDTIATTSRYLADIETLRAMSPRGDVIPSFGGWSADQGNTEIGDSCKNVAAIAAGYQQVVDKYQVTRLDMDIEGRSLTKPDGIDRRNKALAIFQATNPGVQIQYTLPTSRDGLEASGLAVLQNAIDNGVRVDVVNPMVFDYYDRVVADMGDSAITALEGLHEQMKALWPAKTDAELWAMTGATIMNGLDDYPRRTEETTVQDAQQLVAFANLHGMSTLSMWAIQRDNGDCPGSTGSNDCSGIVQSTWEFTNTLAPFTSP
jgi:Glycosyl hydrolases family 18